MISGSFGVLAEPQHKVTQLSNPILVDVRTDAEWNDGYIETAIHIPLDKILEKIELAAEDLRMATRHLGSIVGKVDIEEILGSIFKDFCIGK